MRRYAPHARAFDTLTMRRPYTTTGSVYGQYILNARLRSMQGGEAYRRSPRQAKGFGGLNQRQDLPSFRVCAVPKYQLNANLCYD